MIDVAKIAEALRSATSRTKYVTITASGKFSFATSRKACAIPNEPFITLKVSDWSGIYK